MLFINNKCIKKPEYKGLLNFVALNSDVEKSNNLVRTLLAMINQPIDQNTRQQIVNKFEKIAYGLMS